LLSALAPIAVASKGAASHAMLGCACHRPKVYAFTSEPRRRSREAELQPLGYHRCLPRCMQRLVGHACCGQSMLSAEQIV